jgi:uncharacterized membrane protein
MKEFITNPLYIFSMIAALIIISEWLVKKTILKAGGTALLVIILMAIVTNTGFAPPGTEAGNVYGVIQNYMAPLAIFYLLLDVNLKNLSKAGLPMLLMFFIGSAGTFVGCLVAYFMVPEMKEFGEFSAPLSGMFAATYTGGGLNFNAVALHYGMMEQGNLFAGAVAVDNVMTTLWIIVTIQGPLILQRFFPRTNKVKAETKSLDKEIIEDHIQFNSFAELIFWGILILLISNSLSNYIQSAFNFTIPSILILTTFSLVMAQIKRFHTMKGNQTLGLYLVYFFLATVGAYCEIPTMIGLGSLAMTLFLFVLIAMVIHGLVIFGTAALLKMDWHVVAIASQANIGGQSTAMALAKSFGKNDLILPAILVGTLGNGLGTYLGFLLAAMLG